MSKKPFLKLISIILFIFPARVSWRLFENAILGWGDDRIAERFGVISPSITQVIDFAVKWGIPIIFSGIAVWIIFRVAFYLARQDVAEALRKEDKNNIPVIIKSPIFFKKGVLNSEHRNQKIDQVKTNYDRKPLASVKLLYDADKRDLTIFDKIGVKLAILDRNMSLTTPASTFLPTIKLVTELENGPYEIRIINISPVYSFGGISELNFSILSNTKDSVVIAVTEGLMRPTSQEVEITLS